MHTTSARVRKWRYTVNQPYKYLYCQCSVISYLYLTICLNSVLNAYVLFEVSPHYPFIQLDLLPPWGNIDWECLWIYCWSEFKYLSKTHLTCLLISHWLTTERLRELFLSAGYEVVDCGYVSRTLTNIKQGIELPRVFIQGRFKKPLTAVNKWSYVIIVACRKDIDPRIKHSWGSVFILTTAICASCYTHRPYD